MNKQIVSLALSLCLGLGLSVPAGAAGAAFTDVPTSHWAYSYVSRAADNGWIYGIGNNQFAPNNTLSFAEFYTMVVPIFAAEDLAAYQAPAGSQWWQPYMWVGAGSLQANTIWLDMYNAGLLQTKYDVALQSSINQHATQPITRTDAISILWRVMGEDSATRFIPGVDAARDKLVASGAHFNLMEEDTVPVCYAAGLISGDENGNLNLDGTLTRAEGCVMLCNLVDYMLAHGRMTSTGATIPFQLPGSSSSTGGTTAAYTLKNGKPVTEDNVIAMLQEIEQQYPTGTPWTDSKENPNTLSNPNPVSASVRSWFNRYGTSAKYACGGFAAMVSDLIFPEDAPMREVTDFSKVRPGDIVFNLRNGVVEHVWVPLSASIPSDGLRAEQGYHWQIVDRADGNLNWKVSWERLVPVYLGDQLVYTVGGQANVQASPTGIRSQAETPAGEMYQVIFTRYPD